MLNRSDSDFDSAKKYIAGGVNSPVRAFGNLDMEPIFMDRGQGKYIYDVHNKKYIDFCLSWGASILGHAHPEVIKAVGLAISKGTSFGTPTRVETELARMVCQCMQSIDKVRFVNSGTEAVMTAVRLARGFTQKDIIVKFDGCYHGHSDCLLVGAGSGVSSLPLASSQGVPSDIIRNTISIPFNDPEIFEKTIQANKGKVAAVLMEPVPANMGLVLPDNGFLELIREMTSRMGILLIFDEVITGFRLGLGGAQEYFNIYSDLTCLGKIVGGGFPVGALGGRDDVMAFLAPDGPVYQAGTLSGNPVAMTAGAATLAYLKEHQDVYKCTEAMVAEFTHKWRAQCSLTINSLSSMFTIFHTDKPVKSFGDALGQSGATFKHWFRCCLEQGMYMPPSKCETAFVSAEHEKEDLEKVLGIYNRQFTRNVAENE